MLRSRHRKRQVDEGFCACCLDVLTVFTNERVRVEGGMNGKTGVGAYALRKFRKAASGGERSRQSRRNRKPIFLAGRMSSRTRAEQGRDENVTPVKTGAFGGDAA